MTKYLQKKIWRNRPITTRYANFPTRNHVTFCLFVKVSDREEWMEAILVNLSASDVKILIKSEEELAACQGFDRVFPTSETQKYFQFMEEASV